MGFLIAAAQSRSDEEFTTALKGVRVQGKVHKSGPWWWTYVFYLHFKELKEALSSFDPPSLSAYAGDSVWKLQLFGMNQLPFSLWFDCSLASQRGIEKAKVSYEGNTRKLAEQFGLSREDRKLIRDLPFEEAVAQLLNLQIQNILNAFQRFSIAHDPVLIREILLNPTTDELDSEIGNLPRFLEGIGLTGLLEN